MSRFLAPNRLSYDLLRGIQISIVFCVTIFVQELFRYPRAGWTGFAVMMIYAGFDNGTTLLRAYHRFQGVILGLFSGYLLWFLGHIDYRLLVIIIPITVFFAYFFVGQAYSVPTIFTVNTSLIGTGYFDTHNLFSLTYFLTDYSICTIIAFAIILIFEYFFFRRYNMMRRFIADTQASILKDLYHLVYLLNQDKIRRPAWFKGCIALTENLFEVEKLARNAQFIIGSEQVVGDEFNQFMVLTNRVFVGLKGLYFAYHTPRYHKFDFFYLFDKVQADLNQLRVLLANEQIIDPTAGVLYAAPR